MGSGVSFFSHVLRLLLSGATHVCPLCLGYGYCGVYQIILYCTYTIQHSLGYFLLGTRKQSLIPCHRMCVVFFIYAIVEYELKESI